MYGEKKISPIIKKTNPPAPRAGPLSLEGPTGARRLLPFKSLLADGHLRDVFAEDVDLLCKKCNSSVV